MRHVYGSATALACLLLTACATPPPPRPAPPPPPPDAHVSYRAVPDKSAKHYQVSQAQTIVNPLPEPRNAAPVYPPRLVHEDLPPTSVRVKLIVDAEGQVTATHFAKAATPDSSRQAFQKAVRDAVSDWTFQPLMIEEWTTEADGSQKVVKSTPKPFSQDYVFHFKLVNGKPVVTNGAAPEPAASSPRE